MKFLDKLKSRKLSKLLSVAAVGGMLFFCNGDALAAENADGMTEFRQSYLASSPDNRAFRQIIANLLNIDKTATMRNPR